VDQNLYKIFKEHDAKEAESLLYGLEPNIRFKSNSKSFENLVNYRKQPTNHLLVSLTTNNDSSKIMALCKVDNS
jgi:hypothetical protein